MIKMSVAMLFIPFVIISCAHHNDVRPQASGEHQFVKFGKTKEFLSEESYRQAKHFCDEKNKSVTIVSEKVTFEGTMSEETYAKVKGTSDAVKALGGSAMIFGDKKAKQAGAVLTVGGATADAAVSDQKYKMIMTFKCE